MTRLIPAMPLFVLAAAAQSLTVLPSPIQGLELIAPQSPDYPALVTQIVGPDRPAGLAAALPYGIVIRNGTSQTITAIDTVWTSQNQVLLDAADTLFNQPALYVKPGQAVLAIPPGLLQNQRQLRIFANGAAPIRRLGSFQNGREVTVDVDAVVFESGQFAGADRYGAFERWVAQIQAPRDLANAVLQKQGSQSTGDIVSWLEGLAAVRRPPAGPHSEETVLAARVLLAAYRSKGEAELYSHARNIVDKPAFPLHR